MKRISTKRKKELYSISSLVFHLIVFICLLVSLGNDADNTPKSAKYKNATSAGETRSPLDGFFASAWQ